MLSLSRASLGLARLVSSNASTSSRGFSLSTVSRRPEEHSDRESDQTDVVIVGGGPSGLAAAIRLRQLALAANQPDFRVVLLEKGSEVGAHILSGAVMEPKALTELLPNWREDGAPLDTPVTSESWQFLTETGSIPIPPLFADLQNHGNYIISLGQVCRWLGEQAEALGVEVFPGFAGAEVLYREDGSVKGVATNDVGIAKDGSLKDSHQQGMEFHARLTLFAEGARGHLTQQVEKRFNLREGVSHQTFGIGLKELWRVAPGCHLPGHIQHTFGWPLKTDTYGGSFEYHYKDDNLVATGFVVGLTYKNPYLDPYKEFQRWKTHPKTRKTFEGGECVSYGARVISAGGLQSLPKLYFPGGALVGDCAGFLNVPKIKGSHAAIKSGSLCAESAFEALNAASANSDAAIELRSYPDAFKRSWLHDELHRVRNFKPAWKWGTYAGAAIGGLDSFVLRGQTPWTLKHAKADDRSLKKASEYQPIEYPKPDGKLTFDRLENVARTNTSHEEDQPCHLTLKDPSVPVSVNLAQYAGPEQRFCPAGVYEFVQDTDGKPKLQINQSNCIHCKTCDVKDSNIVWVTPEGGGGPLYSNM